MGVYGGRRRRRGWRGFAKPSVCAGGRRTLGASSCLPPPDLRHTAQPHTAHEGHGDVRRHPPPEYAGQYVLRGWLHLTMLTAVVVTQVAQTVLC